MPQEVSARHQNSLWWYFRHHYRTAPGVNRIKRRFNVAVLLVSPLVCLLLVPPRSGPNAPYETLANVLAFNSLAICIWLIGSSNFYYRWRRGEISNGHFAKSLFVAILLLYLLGAFLAALSYVIWWICLVNGFFTVYGQNEQLSII
jgi:hypothetical protein